MNESTNKPAYCTVSLTKETIDPAKAEEMLSWELHVQRNIRPLVVERYAAAMRRGEWVGGDGVIVVGVTESGKRRLVAGYHRLHAVIKSGVTIEATVDVRKFPNETELIRGYLTTNTSAPASRGDITKALQTGGNLGMSTGTANRYVSALRFIAMNFENSTGMNGTSGAEVSKLGASWAHDAFTDWESEIQFYERTANQAPRGMYKHWRKVAVISMGLVIVRYQPEKAVTFLHDSCKADGMRRGTPEYAFNEFIRTHDTGSMKNVRLFMTGITRAWNAYYAGRELTVIQPTVKGSRFVKIAGTPFNGAFEGGISVVAGTHTPKK